MRIQEIKKKINFADYLLNRSYANAYPDGAIKHIMEAANILATDITGLDENRLGPQVIQNKLKKLDKKETREFGELYLELWKTTKSKEISKEKTKTFLNKIKKFVDWAQKNLPRDEAEEV